MSGLAVGLVVCFAGAIGMLLLLKAERRSPAGPDMLVPACWREGCPGPDMSPGWPSHPEGCGLDCGQEPTLLPSCPFEPCAEEMARRRREAGATLRAAISESQWSR